METQKEVNFLSINQALLQQNLWGWNEQQFVMIYVVFTSFKSFPQDLKTGKKKTLQKLLQVE